jgi:hypothetical protein
MIKTIENGENSINESDINNFEKRFNLKLPKDYREFLLKNNGGKPTFRKFITVCKKIKSSIMLFFPIAEIETENLERNYLLFNQGNKTPKNLVPIGHDPIKNQICISVEGEDFGYVYFWDMDEEVNLVPSYKNMVPIAKSFTEFIDCLSESW